MRFLLALIVIVGMNLVPAVQGTTQAGSLAAGNTRFSEICMIAGNEEKKKKKKKKSGETGEELDEEPECD